MRLIKIWMIPVAMGLVGCGGEVVSSTPSQAADGLYLTSSSAERLSGTFARNGVGVVFDSVKTDAYAALTLRTLGGKELLKAETATDSLTTQIMDGATQVTVTRDYAMKSIGTTATGVQSGITVAGDADAYNQLAKLPEFAVLPHLSRALGAQGFTGASYQSALPIHLFAMRAAKTLNIDVEPLSVAQPTTGYCNAMTDGSHADWYGNGCYGMCGPGCSPWGWVCGDNCAHSGCAAHDQDCRDGDWWGCYVGFWYVFFSNGGCGLTWPW